jgi:2-dehydrotetronate isomerase
VIRLDPNLRWLYTELPMAERTAAAAADGFRGVEIAFPYDVPASERRSQLEAYGLHLVQILSPLDWDGGERGLVAVPGREEDFARSVDVAIEYAAACERPLIHVALGNVPTDCDPDASRAAALANLREAASQAKRQGLTLIVEACCSASFPAFFMHSIAETVAFLDELGRENVKLCFDTYHVAMDSGNDLDAALDAAWPHIGHVQIGNTPGRHEPGEGDLDLVAFIEEIERRGWSSWVGLEYTPRHGTAASLQWARDLGLLPKRAC